MLSQSVFWDYAVNLYGKTGVTDVCLKLQDELGLNVNLILLLCYAEQHRLQISSKQLKQLVQCVDKWHREYTKPLRRIRRDLALEDSATVEAKRAIFDAEIELEKAEQKLLLGCYNRLELQSVDSAQNLQRYIGLNEAKAPLIYGADIELLRERYSA